MKRNKVSAADSHRPLCSTLPAALPWIENYAIVPHYQPSKVLQLKVRASVHHQPFKVLLLQQPGAAASQPGMRGLKQGNSKFNKNLENTNIFQQI